MSKKKQEILELESLSLINNLDQTKEKISGIEEKVDEVEHSDSN
jgi:hypothetical protein